MIRAVCVGVGVGWSWVGCAETGLRDDWRRRVSSGGWEDCDARVGRVKWGGVRGAD